MITKIAGIIIKKFFIKKKKLIFEPYISTKLLNLNDRKLKQILLSIEIIPHN